ncbi:zygote arrest protein 1-like [Lynx pardinus]|uniref:Zygote arrest protein 1-like n=1 Tax=Lynx pardinus TaxID=191816 RepID=A0A485MZR6_LYNPA|nr:zygote arrest protein 1-like [Lynx pardinus]
MAAQRGDRRWGRRPAAYLGQGVCGSGRGCAYGCPGGRGAGRLHLSQAHAKPVWLFAAAPSSRCPSNGRIQGVRPDCCCWRLWNVGSAAYLLYKTLTVGTWSSVDFAFGRSRRGTQQIRRRTCWQGEPIPKDPTLSQCNMAKAVTVISWESTLIQKLNTAKAFGPSAVVYCGLSAAGLEGQLNPKELACAEGSGNPGISRFREDVWLFPCVSEGKYLLSNLPVANRSFAASEMKANLDILWVKLHCLFAQFLEQKYGYYHCKDCNIRWESAYVWCVQGTNKVYFKQFCRTCQKSYNPYRVEDITCQSCKQTRCSCPVKLRHVDPKRPHRQDLCGRCKGKRLSCDSTFSFKYII